MTATHAILVIAAVTACAGLAIWIQFRVKIPTSVHWTGETE